MPVHWAGRPCELDKIRKIAIKYGASAPFLRPANLSHSKAKAVDCDLHALKFAEKEYKKNEVVKPEIVQILKKNNKVMDILPASPKVRKFARELGIDINQVEGSEKDGRVIFAPSRYALLINSLIKK